MTEQRTANVQMSRTVGVVWASQLHFTLNNGQITKITLFGCFPSEIFFSSIAVENSWKIKLWLKPVGITAKTSLPSSKQFTAILCPCFCSKCKLELTESLRNTPWVTKSTDARRVTWNVLRLHWILSSVIFNQSDRCVRQRTRGIQKSIARVQAHFSSPHSSRRLRRLAIAAPPPLPIKWACSQATIISNITHCFQLQSTSLGSKEGIWKLSFIQASAPSGNRTIHSCLSKRSFSLFIKTRAWEKE